MMSDDPLANWNGVEMPLSEARVSVLDRGFLFGDGVYEVLRVYRGQPFLESEHLDRFRRSLDKVSISCNVDQLIARMHETLAQSEVQEGLIYIQVTRGTAPRTHRFPASDTAANELIYVEGFTEAPYASFREDGGTAITVPDMRWKRCDIKSVNLLANCMAAQQAAEAGCVEALLVDENGIVNEGSHTSVFGVRDGSILTSPLSPSILPGITRGLVTRLAERCQIPLDEHCFAASEISKLDELFLTGTTAEVLPLVEVDGTAVNDGRPGPVTRQLQSAYQDFVAETVAEMK